MSKRIDEIGLYMATIGLFGLILILVSIGLFASFGLIITNKLWLYLELYLEYLLLAIGLIGLGIHIYESKYRLSESYDENEI